MPVSIRRIAFAVALLCVAPAAARAQPPGVSLWGGYHPGTHQLADEQVRYFAFSYVGNLNDNRAIHAKTNEVIAHLNRVNQTHEWKDGNGNFHEVQLGQDRVFVIGFANVTRNYYGFLATIPGTAAIRDHAGQPITNTGWYRHNYPVNGRPVYFQFGMYRGKVQWCLGDAR